MSIGNNEKFQIVGLAEVVVVNSRRDLLADVDCHPLLMTSVLDVGGDEAPAMISI